MKRLVLLVCLSCGPAVELPTPAVGPRGPELLPPGWYVHTYPGLCVVVARDVDGGARTCVEWFPTPCVPTNTAGCAALSLASSTRLGGP